MDESLNLMHLKFFIDVINQKSFSKAAKANFISQSGISQGILKLESQFKTKLYSYNKEKVLKLTKDGKILHEQSEEILKILNETFEKLELAKSRSIESLEFLTSISLGMSFIAPLYQELKKNLPFDLKFTIDSSNLIRKSLKNEEVEFALVVNEPGFEQYEKRTIKKGVFNLYQSKKAKKDLIQQGIFIYEEASLHVANLKAFLQEKDYEVPLYESISGWELAARFVELNMGVAFFPDYILYRNRYPQIVPHPLKIPAFEYEICVIYNKGHKLSKEANLFLDTLTSIS